MVPHQDDTFLRTGPEKSTIGVWIALEKCTIENGCLRALPRSHFNGTKKRMFVDHEAKERRCSFRMMVEKAARKWSIKLKISCR